MAEAESKRTQEPEVDQRQGNPSIFIFPTFIQNCSLPNNRLVNVVEQEKGSQIYPFKCMFHNCGATTEKALSYAACQPKCVYDQALCGLPTY